MHVIVQTRDLEELTKMGQLLASRQGLLSLRLRGSRFINVHCKELTSCYRCSGLKLYTLDLSLTDLLDSTAESLFDQLSVFSVCELNFACTKISFSALNALYRNYERNKILELPNHLRELNLGLTELTSDCVPILQGILGLSKELRTLNLEYTGITPQ